MEKSSKVTKLPTRRRGTLGRTDGGGKASQKRAAETKRRIAKMTEMDPPAGRKGGLAKELHDETAEKNRLINFA